jgi:hypothetical protein
MRLSLKSLISTTVHTLGDRLGYSIIARRRLDRFEEIRHLRALFGMLEIDCVVDAGAGIGQYPAFVRQQLGYGGPIVSLAPAGEMFDPMQPATAADPGWSVHAVEHAPGRGLDAAWPDVMPALAARVFLRGDLSVIRGTTARLGSVPAIQLELPMRESTLGAPHYLDALGQLEAMGYEVTGLFPVQRDATLRIVSLDAVLIRRDAAERRA